MNTRFALAQAVKKAHFKYSIAYVEEKQNVVVNSYVEGSRTSSIEATQITTET